MQALHKKGIVHRDLKPQNVLLTPDGQAKVADMGLSKTLPTHVSSFDSLGGSGSSGWQAPEQIHVLPPAGAACDRPIRPSGIRDPGSSGRTQGRTLGSSHDPVHLLCKIKLMTSYNTATHTSQASVAFSV